MAKKKKLSASWWQAAQLLGFQDMTSSPPTEENIVAELGNVMRKYAKTQADLYKSEERRRTLFRFYLDAAKALGWEDPIMQSPTEAEILDKLRTLKRYAEAATKVVGPEIIARRAAGVEHPGFGKAGAILGDEPVYDPTAPQKMRAVAEVMLKPQTLVGRVERLERHVGL